MRRLTQEEFINKARDKHNDKYDYSKTEYKNGRSKITIICPEHGEFLQLAQAHLSGQGCPKCKTEQTSIKRTHSKKELLKKFCEIHGDKYLYKFEDSNKHSDYIEVTCLVHSYTYRQRIANHLLGHGCPLCNGGVNLTTEGFLKKATLVHDKRYDYSLVEYVNKDTPVAILCEQHGVFYQTPHNHINGNGCPKCKAWKTQQKIYNFLCTNFPEEKWYWEYSPEWLGLQRFDIYNKRVNLAIEYNGKQHYVPIERFGGKIALEQQQLWDQNKAEKCKLNNCTLYTIKYDELNFNNLKKDINSILKSKNHDY